MRAEPGPQQASLSMQTLLHRPHHLPGFLILVTNIEFHATGEGTFSPIPVVWPLLTTVFFSLLRAAPMPFYPRVPP